MKLAVIAIDYDGTIATDGTFDASVSGPSTTRGGGETYNTVTAGAKPAGDHPGLIERVPRRIRVVDRTQDPANGEHDGLHRLPVQLSCSLPAGNPVPARHRDCGSSRRRSTRNCSPSSRWAASASKSWHCTSSHSSSSPLRAFADTATWSRVAPGKGRARIVSTFWRSITTPSCGSRPASNYLQHTWRTRAKPIARADGTRIVALTIAPSTVSAQPMVIKKPCAK